MKFFEVDDMPLSDYALKMLWLPWLNDINDGNTLMALRLRNRITEAFNFILLEYKAGKVTSKQARAYLDIMKLIYTIMFRDKTLKLPSMLPAYEYVYHTMEMVYIGNPDNTFMNFLEEKTGGDERDYLISVFVEAFTNTYYAYVANYGQGVKNLVY
jgi:hypothetical protein